MTIPCLEPEELGDLESLPPDDPRRAHVATCARCQARLAALRAFEASPPLTPARAAEVRARLSTARQGWFAGSAARPASRPEPAGAWWRGLFGPTLRPAWIGLAAVVLVVALIARFRGGQTPTPPVLRGPADSSASAYGEVELLMPRLLADGDFELRWHAAPGAKNYRIDIISVELVPLDRGPLQTDTIGFVRRDSLPASLAHGANFYARVVALDDDRQIAESALVSLLAR